MSTYPALARYLKPLWKNAQLKGLSLRKATASGPLLSCGVSYTTLGNWVNGRAFPAVEHVAPLAELFFPADAASQVAVTEQLEELRRLYERSRDAHTQQARGRSIRVASQGYGPFSRGYPQEHPAGKSGFLDAFWGRLFDLSRKQCDPVNSIGPSHSMELLSEGHCDLTFPLFETIDRSERFYQLPFPARISLNACFLQPTREADRIRGALTLGASSPPADRQLITLYCIRSEVGHQYAIDSLKFPPNQVITVENANLAELVSEFIDARPKSNAIPVLLADEFTILSAVPEFEKRNREPWLVFPLATQQAADSVKRDMPVYLLSLATANGEDEVLKEFITRSTRILLAAETSFTAQLYQDLYRGLRDEVLNCLHRLSPGARAHLEKIQCESVRVPERWHLAMAERYVRYTLRLGETDREMSLGDRSLSWRPILSRVRDRIGPTPEGTEDTHEGCFRLGFRAFEPFCGVDDNTKRGGTKAPTDIRSFGFCGNLLAPFGHLYSPDLVHIMDGGTEFHDISSSELNYSPTDDVRIGFFETPVRGGRWKFLRLPFSLPLNAVYIKHARQPSYINDLIRRALTLDGQISERRSIQLVVLKGGSTHEYVRGLLGFTDEELCLVEKFDPADFAARLVEKCDVTRVAFIDILTCLKIQREVLSQGAVSDLVFSLAEVTSNGANDNYGLPIFRLGIMVNRDSSFWLRYFFDEFPNVLQSHSEWYTRCVVELYKDLVKKLRSRWAEAGHPSAGVRQKSSQRDTFETIAQHYLSLVRPGELDGDLKPWARILSAAASRVNNTL